MTPTVPGLIVLVVTAAVCGAIGKALAAEHGAGRLCPSPSASSAHPSVRGSRASCTSPNRSHSA